MNIYIGALEILKKKTSVRKLLVEMHSEDVQRIVDRLESVYVEKLEEEKAVEAEVYKKKESLEAIKAQMRELGISVDELAGFTGSVAADKPKRKYKERQKFTFQYENKSGEQLKWVGANAGRKPADFSNYLERTGKSADKCKNQGSKHSQKRVLNKCD